MTNHEKQVHASDGTRLNVTRARGGGCEEGKAQPERPMHGRATPPHPDGFQGQISDRRSVPRKLTASTQDFRRPDMAKAFCRKHASRMWQLFYNAYGQ